MTTATASCSATHGAAHCAGMNTSPVHRQPQGTPAGGQFAPASHTEAGVNLISSADLPLSLEPGESEDYSEYADGDVINRLSVLRSDDGATFHVEASTFLNLRDIIPASDLGTDEAGRDSWLDTNSSVIASFIRDRYDADADTTDWDDVRIECGTSIQADSVTGRQIANEAWNRTWIVQLHNESDHGTFGSENLGRLIREHVRSQVIAKDVNAARGAAARMTAADIHNQVNEWVQTGNRVSDACAVAFARTVDPLKYPEVRNLGRMGFGDRTKLRDQLLNAYDDAGNNTQRAGIGMMLAWLADGGDNS
jgi:hypothetical protein